MPKGLECIKTCRNIKTFTGTGRGLTNNLPRNSSLSNMSIGFRNGRNVKSAQQDHCDQGGWDGTINCHQKINPAIRPKEHDPSGLAYREYVLQYIGDLEDQMDEMRRFSSEDRPIRGAEKELERLDKRIDELKKLRIPS